MPARTFTIAHLRALPALIKVKEREVRLKNEPRVLFPLSYDVVGMLVVDVDVKEETICLHIKQHN